MTNRKSSWYIRAQRDGRLLPDRSGSMRNATVDGTFKGPIHLNRARRWKTFWSYAKAREMSPSAEPVR